MSDKTKGITVKLKPVLLIEIEMNGSKLPGQFEVTDEWNGLIELQASGGRRMKVIIKAPGRPENPYNFISKLFGGNMVKGSITFIESKIISFDDGGHCPELMKQFNDQL